MNPQKGRDLKTEKKEKNNLFYKLLITIMNDTDKCRLEFYEWYLTCMYNHKIWEDCLMKYCNFCDKNPCICYDDLEKNLQK